MIRNDKTEYATHARTNDL